MGSLTDETGGKISATDDTVLDRTDTADSQPASNTIPDDDRSGDRINQNDHPVGTRLLVEREEWVGTGAPDHDITILEWSPLGSKMRSHVNVENGVTAWHDPASYNIVDVLNVDGSVRENGQVTTIPLTQDAFPVGSRFTFVMSGDEIYSGEIVSWSPSAGTVCIRSFTDKTIQEFNADDIHVTGILDPAGAAPVSWLDAETYPVGTRLKVISSQTTQEELTVTIMRWGKDAPQQSDDLVRLMFEGLGGSKDTWVPIDVFMVTKVLEPNRLSTKDHPIGSMVSILTKIKDDLVGPVNVIIVGYSSSMVTVKLGNNSALSAIVRSHLSEETTLKRQDVQVLKVVRTPKAAVAQASQALVKDIPEKNEKHVGDDMLYHIAELKRLGKKSGHTVQVILT